MSADTAGGGGGAGAVVRQGHLRKLRKMKKKYFVLRAETADCSARLEYYESEKKFRSGAPPRRVLPLKSCYNITRRLDLKQKHVIALFTREEQFCIVAENEQELHGWLTAILKQHRSDDASGEFLHPIQHVWQVNVQKKGLGASKNIQGLYNLCLTDKTITLVKIKSHNNVISDLGIPEKIEYALKNIRRCGDSECFFYLEVGQQTSTGSGELWMHSEDSNIAQSMHSTIYLAMRNCAKDNENERDHIVLPGESGALPRSSSLTGRPARANAGGLCVGACLKQCVCESAAYSLGDAAPLAPPTPPTPLAQGADFAHAENQPPNNSLSSDSTGAGRVIKHHRTVSLPAGCGAGRDGPRAAHERTRSAPLAGDDPAAAPAPAPATANAPWPRRASTGARLSKLSPAHTKNAGPLRTRSDSMPSRACSSFEVERPAPRHVDLEGPDASRDETDSLAEWYRTPRIPEEPDLCDVSRDFISSGGRVGGPIGSVQHSRTSSMGTEDALIDGYLPMAPGHEPLPALVSASSGSVCSGTPSTDPRFSEYQLEPATSHIVEGTRPPRAWSVGSRAAVGAHAPSAGERHRAYSVGAHCRPRTGGAPRAPASAPLLPRASADDLMELDFSANCSPQPKVIVARTPPAAGFMEPRSRANTDEYVDMSPRTGFLPPAPAPAPNHAPLQPTHTAIPDGYVEMNYTRAPSRPIAIASRSSNVPPPQPSPPRLAASSKTPLGSQTIFPISLESPASPPELNDADVFDDDAKDSWRWSRPRATGGRLPPAGVQTIFSLSPDSSHGRDAKDEQVSHPLTTVREISEESGRRSPPGAASSSPQYVRLLAANPTANKTLATTRDARASASCSTATVVVAGGVLPAARFAAPAAAPPPPSPTAPSPAPALQYAALDLQPRRASQPPPPRTYTQIDFLRSEKLHADAT